MASKEDIPPWLMKHFFSEVWFILQNRSIGFSGPAIGDFYSNTDFFWQAFLKTGETKQLYTIQKKISEKTKAIQEIQAVEAAPNSIPKIPNDWLDISFSCLGLHRTSRDKGLLKEMVRTTKVGGELILVIAQGSSRWNAVFGSTPFLEEVALPGTQSIKRSWNMPEKALLEVAGELGLVLERSFSGSRTIPIGGTTLPWGSPGFSTYVFKVT